MPGAFRRQLVIGLLALFGVAPLRAQDTVSKGVRIGLRYDPGSKPGVLVLPISGPTGDSIKAILERDFDYSDVLTTISLSPEDGSILAGSSTAGGAPVLNYAVFAKLGAAA